MEGVWCGVAMVGGLVGVWYVRVDGWVWHGWVWHGWVACVGGEKMPAAHSWHTATAVGNKQCFGISVWHGCVVSRSQLPILMASLPLGGNESGRGYLVNFLMFLNN